MARSIWKGPFVEGYVLKKAEKVRDSGKNEVNPGTWIRNLKIALFQRLY